MRTNAQMHPTLSNRGRRRSLERMSPFCDFVDAEVEERAHARGVAQIGMGDQPKLGFQIGNGAVSCASPGTDVPI